LTLLPRADSAVIDAVACPPFMREQQLGRLFSRCVNGKMDIGAVDCQNPANIIFRNGLDPI
jgi:hypothetical protein